MESFGSKWFNWISKIQDLHSTSKRGKRFKIFCWKTVLKKLHRWQCDMKRAQHEISATRKKQYENCTTQKKEKHENSAIPKKCKLEIEKHEKIATRKKRKVKIVQYEQSIVTDWNFEKNCIRRVHTNAVLNSAYQWRGLLTILPVLISKMKAIIMKISQATGIIDVVIYRCNHN